MPLWFAVIGFSSQDNLYRSARIRRQCEIGQDSEGQSQSQSTTTASRNPEEELRRRVGWQQGQAIDSKGE